MADLTSTNQQLKVNAQSTLSNNHKLKKVLSLKDKQMASIREENLALSEEITALRIANIEATAKLKASGKANTHSVNVR